MAAVATVIAIVALWPSPQGSADAAAQGARLGLGSERFAATVTDVTEGSCSYSTRDRPSECRVVEVTIDEGRFAGLVTEFTEFNLEYDVLTPDVVSGDGVMAGYEPSTEAWFYADRDRRGSLLVLALLFAAVVIALGRWRGLAALLGMAITLAVLVVFVAPSVLDGNDPLLVAIVAASAIGYTSLYLTHGLRPTTTIALAGTLLSLGITLALAWVFFAVSRFTGLANEEALLLPFIAGDIELSSLLLGGAVIATLGALDDVTVTQVATVAELHRHTPDLSRRKLFASGIRVGRDHIASTVNTLLLAYVGASMPLVLLFAVSDQPLDKVANSELLAVEIVRTLCGSIGLVAAVPLTTGLAAFALHQASARADTSTTDPEPHAASAPPEPTEHSDPPEPQPEQTEPEPQPVQTLLEEPPPPKAPSWSDFSPDSDDLW